MHRRFIKNTLLNVIYRLVSRWIRLKHPQKDRKMHKEHSREYNDEKHYVALALSYVNHLVISFIVWFSKSRISSSKHEREALKAGDSAYITWLTGFCVYVWQGSQLQLSTSTGTVRPYLWGESSVFTSCFQDKHTRSPALLSDKCDVLTTGRCSRGAPLCQPQLCVCVLVALFTHVWCFM